MHPSSRPAFLVATLAELLRERRHIVVGANLPIPAAAALLARRASGKRLEVEILGSRNHSVLIGIGDLYDFACQGRFDGFFLSPGQIDAHGNVNLVGIGTYPRLDVRWPGSHGSPLLYMMIPNVILFREFHLRRVLVPQVDFVSAPGISPANVFRPGGPGALVTGMAAFRFDRAKARFCLGSIHPGCTEEAVVANTGFAYERSEQVHTTPLPPAHVIDWIASGISEEIAEIYPSFAQTLASSARSLRGDHA